MFKLSLPAISIFVSRSPTAGGAIVIGPVSGPEGVVPSISGVQFFADTPLAPECRVLFKLLSSDDEPFVDAVELAEEQVVDITSKAFSMFFAGVDFVESEVVGLKTPTVAPREEICW
jgi:hypothetical protein